ncbi:MAG: hypothetical protein SPJ69_05635 [Campylobacter sp.]|nr:hypothetical protein [Campylobacter sp.]MDD7599996.1 hypothetical protein [Campylobacteraceae bacterium]MDY5887785.1 hypothetical protein [Campylobacter sp.]
MRLLRFARNDENSKFPKPCVIPQRDWGISSNRRHCGNSVIARSE